MADEQSDQLNPNESDPQAGSADDLGYSTDDIDALLGAAKNEAVAVPTSPAAKIAAEFDESPDADDLTQASEYEALSGNAMATDELELPTFDDAEVASAATQSINLLRDVQLHVKVELGRTYMFVEDVLRLGEGSVVELDKLAGDPVDVYVNDRLVARGEVLVLNDNFCVRVSEIVERSDARRAG